MKKGLTKKENKKIFVYTGGLEGSKKNFLENLAILMSAGMDVLAALRSVENEFSSRRMRRFIRGIISQVEEGGSFWQAMEESGIFSPRVVSLIRIGEQSGRLVENMNTIVRQQDKEWMFKTKIRTAMLYPAIVLPLTFFVGVGVAWFSLPRLAEVFSQMNIKLPLITRVLIDIGIFFGDYGMIFVPVFLSSFVIILYFLFSFPKTKALGQIFIAKMPIFRRLILEVELARVGYILNGLLESGIPIISSLYSLRDSTSFYGYKKFYNFLAGSIEEGNSFKKSFALYKKSGSLIPKSIQQMIISGEESGRLSETLARIGAAYEAKIETSIKNISTLLEPLLLILIGLAVAAVAFAVFIPIYNLTYII